MNFIRRIIWFVQSLFGSITFIDLDNCLVPFNMEQWQQEQYPLPEVDIPWVSSLPRNSRILSRVNSKGEEKLKMEWCKHYFPHIKCLCVYIPKEKAVCPRGNILISDWHEELFNWQAAGGIPIQLSNGTNHKHFKWFVHWYEDEEGIHLLDENNDPLMFYRKEI